MLDNATIGFKLPSTFTARNVIFLTDSHDRFHRCGVEFVIISLFFQFLVFFVLTVIYFYSFSAVPRFTKNLVA